jgi:hypothetical protein
MPAVAPVWIPDGSVLTAAVTRTLGPPGRHPPRTLAMRHRAKNFASSLRPSAARLHICVGVMFSSAIECELEGKKMRKVRTLLIGCITLTCVAVQLEAQETAVDQEQLMKRWQAFMTPGDSHALLKEREGTWQITIKMWMDPSAPPTVSTGTSVVKMIDDDKWVTEMVRVMPDGKEIKTMEVTYKRAG